MLCLHFSVFSLTNILKTLERCETADIRSPLRVIGKMSGVDKRVAIVTRLD